MQSIDIKQILAAVDFSDWTRPVLQTAGELARRYTARLTAVYAETFLPPPYFTERAMDRMAEMLSTQREEARRYLADAVGREIGEGGVADTRLAETSPAEGILAVAEEVGAGMIILGTHGRTGWNRLILGSVAERVVRQSRVPVLTVRGAGEKAAECRLPFRRILCPVNYTEVALESMRYATDMARRFEAELVVMTSLEEGQAGSEEAIGEQERRMCDWVPESVRTQCKLKPVVRRGDAAEQVLVAAKETESDLIVIGAQHRPLLEATIFGTTSIRVMRHATCPVLTVVRH